MRLAWSRVYRAIIHESDTARPAAGMIDRPWLNVDGGTQGPQRTREDSAGEPASTRRGPREEPEATRGEAVPGWPQIPRPPGNGCFGSM